MDEDREGTLPAPPRTYSALMTDLQHIQKYKHAYGLRLYGTPHPPKQRPIDSC